MLMKTKNRRQDTRTTAEAHEQRDMANYKPYRTAAQKWTARTVAKKIDGRFVSFAPVSHHAKRAEQ